MAIVVPGGLTFWFDANNHKAHSSCSGRRVSEPARSMTIAAGFRCLDGVVLCGDSDITFNLAKSPESEVRLEEGLKCSPAFVFAGDRGFSSMAVETVAKAIAAAEEKGSDVIESIQKALREIHRRYSASPAFTNQKRYHLRALLSLWISESRHLFSITGPCLARVEGHTCIGVGQTPGSDIAKMIFDANLTVDEAVYAALYLIFTAKECTPGCGEKSQILTLSDKRKSGRFIKRGLPTHVQQENLEAIYRTLHREMRDVLGCGDPNLAEEDYQESLNRFAESLTVTGKPLSTLFEVLGDQAIM